MNRGQIVRANATAKAVEVRVWIDDIQGHHLTVAELTIPAHTIAHWVVAVEKEQEQSDQYQLAFDD